jgi:hypothetical protein
MWTAIGTILAAALGAGVSIWGQSEQNKATASAGAEAQKLSEQQREDVLMQQSIKNQFTQQGMAENKREFNVSTQNQKDQYNQNSIMSNLRNLQAQSDKSPEYAKELVSMWGV